jgi:hypothetical protein
MVNNSIAHKTSPCIYAFNLLWTKFLTILLKDVTFEPESTAHFVSRVVSASELEHRMICYICDINACNYSRLRAKVGNTFINTPLTFLSKKNDLHLHSQAMKGLEVTLMERLIQSRQGERGIVRMLTTQYRMNAAIMTWSSEALYAGRLVAGAAVAAHTLADLPQVFFGFILGFLYIFTQKRKFLGFFQFQEYF